MTKYNFFRGHLGASPHDFYNSEYEYFAHEDHKLWRGVARMPRRELVNQLTPHSLRRDPSTAGVMTVARINDTQFGFVAGNPGKKSPVYFE